MKQPSVGPLVGQNMSDMLRVFVRGEEGFEYATIFIHPQNESSKAISKTIPLKKQFDYCNVFLIPNLIPDTRYEYKVGVHSTKDIEESETDIEPKYSIKIAPKEGKVNFLLGSCRYIMESNDHWFFTEHSDKTYRTALQECGVERGEIDLMLHMGDQIYADDLNILSADTHLCEFQKKYRHAYSSPYFKQMASSIANYMTLDDHEIEDAWPKSATPEKKQMYFNAMRAYQIYQASHSPVVEVEETADKELKLKECPSHWYYSFSSGCADFFMLDVRTERRIDGNTRIISKQQMETFKSWLLEDKSKVKCVVTAVPFLLQLEKGIEDKWSEERFVHQRNEILEFINDNQIEKVIFLSGDIHRSYVSSAVKSPDVPGNKAIKIYQIVSSPLYYPFHFLSMDPDDFLLNGKLDDSNGWFIQQESSILVDNGIGKVSLDDSSFTFEFYKRKGSLDESVTCQFSGRDDSDIDFIRQSIKRSKSSLCAKIFWRVKQWLDFRKHKKVFTK